MFDYYLRLALHRCRQNLRMVALLVLTMAIGIASTMTAMTVFDAFSGAPLPGISPYLYVATMDAREVPDKDGDGYTRPDSYLKLADAKALVDAHRAPQQLALAQSYTQLGNADGTHVEQANGLMIYGEPLGMLGVPLRYGRPWTAQELAARVPVVVIDSELAQQLFGTENAVGRNVMLGKRPFRVVGVIAPWKPRTILFDLARNSGNPLGGDEQFFVPAEAALDAGVGPFTSGECGGGGDAPGIAFQSAAVQSCRWMEVWARLDSPAEVTS